MRLERNKDTREIVDKVWAKHIKNSIGKYQIIEIGRADINDWLDNTLMGYTPSTKRKYLGLNVSKILTNSKNKADLGSSKLSCLPAKLKP